MKAAAELAMATEGAVSYSDVMKMTPIELKVVGEVVAKALKARAEAMKKR